MKAGKIRSGEFLVEGSVKNKEAKIVLVASDASDNTKKLFSNICHTHQIPLYYLGDKEMLGKAIGKPFRASIAVIDENFSKAIKKQLDSFE